MKRILVIDDDPDLLAGLEMVLQERYEVRGVANGAEALAALAKERFDAIVLDLMMPTMDGAAFLSEFTARGKSAPVLVASARGDATLVAQRWGADDVIRKPFDLGELEAKLERLLGS